ncbi:hypothetical protein ACROYT_G041462 [Oculina patagonica]
MSDCCKELLLIVDKYNSENPEFGKDDVLEVVSFALSWPQRQCRCIFRDQLHLARLEDLLQRLLKCAIDRICELRVPAVEEGKKGNETSDEGPDVDITEWSQPDKERLFLAVGKIFQLPFPFYQVRKIHLLRQETTSKDCSKYCDVNDGEVPEALLINVAYFCDNGGLSAIREAFQDADPAFLPFPVAHHLINIVTQLRVWFSIQAIMQYIIPLRRPVIRYLCKLTDKDLRQPDGRIMVDSMWSAVKGPVESGPICDKDSLDLAFKYFTSSTLTVRLAGLSQIANQVHMFMDLFQTDPAAEIDRQCLCTELSQWLIENKLVEHLFGPNLHVELLKQSQIILNYLARETCLTTSHLDCIWLAAQDIFENLAIINAPEGQDDDVYLQTVRTLNAYFRVQENAAYERHVLRQLKQEPGEDVDSFVLRLRKQARHCSYGPEELEFAVRDQLLEKVSSLELRTKLFEEPNIQLAAAIEKAQAVLETTRKAYREKFSIALIIV